MGMNALKTLRYSIIGLVVLTIVLFALSLSTLITALSSAVSGGAFSLNLNTYNSTRDWTLTLDANPKNNAFLDVRLYMEIAVTTLDGKYIVRNSTSVHIPAGGRAPFSLVLTIPLEEVRRYNITLGQGAPVWFEMKFGIRTLGDLVGFEQTMRISGEPRV